MYDLSVSVEKAKYSDEAQCEKAKRDTLEVFEFVFRKQPTPENVLKLRAMLTDPQRLIDFDATCWEEDVSDGNVLHNAKHYEFQQELLRAGAPVDGSGHTVSPLYRALQASRIDRVMLLLEHGANPNYILKRNDGNEYPLYRAIGSDAVHWHLPELFRLITQHGFDPNIAATDRDSSWRFGRIGLEKLSALMDLGITLVRHNSTGQLIHQHITHGNAALQEVFEQRRSEAMQLRDQFEADVKPVLDGTMASADCMALKTLNTPSLMLLSNVDALPMVFRPELWRGNEQRAINLAYTSLYPYQQKTIELELVSLHAKAAAPNSGWQARVSAQINERASAAL